MKITIDIPEDLIKTFNEFIDKDVTIFIQSKIKTIIENEIDYNIETKLKKASKNQKREIYKFFKNELI